MSKDQVSNDYLESMKDRHGGKQVPSTSDREALVVGARPGNIGGSIAERLTDDDFGTVLMEDIEYGLDVNDPGSWDVELQNFDTLILANGETRLNWIDQQEFEVIQSVVDSTLTGTMKLVSEFVRATEHQGHHKHIVCIGSMAYRSVLNASAPYCAAKAGLNHFIRCMGWELTPRGYSSFIVHPSNTEGTPMTEETIQGIMSYRLISRKEAEAYWGAINLKEEWLQPSDIADTVSYLVSGRAAYQSGTAIELSGGQR